jgi:hypothetical protein
VNLTKRGKWLTAIAALVAGYVLFGPKDSGPVEPARAATGSAAHAAHAAAASPSTVPVARSLLMLAQRVVDQTSAASLFAAHSWYTAPPPPPPVAAAPVDTTPVAPTAPPLPYQFIGSYKPDGQSAVFFLTRGDRVYDVHVGDTLDDTYSVDSFNNGQLLLTYKPLNVQQQLIAGVSQ